MENILCINFNYQFQGVVVQSSRLNNYIVIAMIQMIFFFLYNWQIFCLINDIITLTTKIS